MCSQVNLLSLKLTYQWNIPIFNRNEIHLQSESIFQPAMLDYVRVGSSQSYKLNCHQLPFSGRLSTSPATSWVLPSAPWGMKKKHHHYIGIIVSHDKDMQGPLRANRYIYIHIHTDIVECHKGFKHYSIESYCSFSCFMLLLGATVKFWKVVFFSKRHHQFFM